MAVQLRQAARMGAYLMTQRLRGIEKYPLIVELEPLFQCNLACEGCGKIQHPEHELRRRMPVDQAVGAVLECGAPMVSIAGGEPLMHPKIHEITAELLKRKKFVVLCTNAVFLPKHIDKFKPNKNFAWMVHLDGVGDRHDEAVAKKGVFVQAVEAIKLAKSKGFMVQINCTLFEGSDPKRVADFFDVMTEMGIDGITISPGYSYERAPDQEHFLNRTKTKELFRSIFARGEGGKKWAFTQSGLFLDFLAGNQTYQCTPWSMPLLTVFGWQKPCYLLGEGYVKTFKELMDDTEWEDYGVGKYEKCADCMVHCGFEGSAVADGVKNPLKLLAVSMKGVKTSGKMAADIPLDNQRPAKFVFSGHVERKLAEIRATQPRSKKVSPTA